MRAGGCWHSIDRLVVFDGWKGSLDRAMIMKAEDIRVKTLDSETRKVQRGNSSRKLHTLFILKEPKMIRKKAGNEIVTVPSRPFATTTPPHHLLSTQTLYLYHSFTGFSYRKGTTKVPHGILSVAQTSCLSTPGTSHNNVPI